MDKDALLRLLGKLGIYYELFEHEPVMTVEESSRFHWNIPGLQCKCLFLKDKNGRYWLLAVPAAMRVNLKSLQRELGSSRLSFADADTLRELLGVRPGAVTLFAAVNDSSLKVAVVMEKSLTEVARFCFHPLVNNATVSLPPQDMCRFLEHTGHKPIVVQGIGL